LITYEITGLYRLWTCIASKLEPSEHRVKIHDMCWCPYCQLR